MDAYDVWMRVHGGSAPVEASDAMRLGTTLEPAILAAAVDRWGWDVRTNSHTYIHQTLPLVATPDARIVNERALVEVKYSGNVALWQYLPNYVWWQVQAQMMCAGTHPLRVEVVVLAGGLRRFTVARNRTAGRRIGVAVRELVNLPHPPEKTRRDYTTIRTHYGNIPESIQGDIHND